jgi:hypothetical protein
MPHHAGKAVTPAIRTEDLTNGIHCEATTGKRSNLLLIDRDAAEKPGEPLPTRLTTSNPFSFATISLTQGLVVFDPYGRQSDRIFAVTRTSRDQFFAISKRVGRAE